jgi:hypothetical protein
MQSESCASNVIKIRENLEERFNYQITVYRQKTDLLPEKPLFGEKTEFRAFSTPFSV